jgi:hypothetical protein
VDALSELLRTGRMNDMGRFEDDVHRITLLPRRRRQGHFSAGERRERAGPGQGRERRGTCTPSSRAMASTSTTSMFSIWREDSDGISTWKLRSASGLCPASPPQKSCRPAIPRLKARPSPCSRSRSVRNWKTGETGQHCRLETHPSFFNFFVEGCQFKPVEPIPCASSRRAIELAGTLPE